MDNGKETAVNATIEAVKLRRRALAAILGIDAESLRCHQIRDTGPITHREPDRISPRGKTIVGEVYYLPQDVTKWLEKRAATRPVLGRTLEQLERWNAYLATTTQGA